MSVLCIIFSVLLVTAIVSMADMALRAQKSYFIKTNGEYHASVTGISEETAEMIGARLDVAVWGGRLGHNLDSRMKLCSIKRRWSS